MYPFGLSAADLKTIRAALEQKKELARGRREALFSVFDEVLGAEERVALEFLYAFMPFVDLADYDGSLFLQHVRHSLQAKNTLPWGAAVSGEMFLHFVLPYRISNEMIEDYRPYFFQELIERVEHLSMAQAILEVNHWCHEKATYTATDPRTASPLTVVRSARGRCGEESALLVAALRSLCLPARQVYTPRWSHTDSNHAWVEAWAGGRWHFLGACEPEPRLNMGWFAGPAKRAMLLHTKVPGTIYAGPEEQVQREDGFTELNLLPNYAPVRRLRVAAKDSEGRPVSGARFDFQVFNYGGFSSIARLKADDKGEAALTTGLGDLLVHASCGEAWGSAFAKADGPPAVEVVLTERFPLETVEFDFAAPPPQPAGGPEVSPAEKAKNDQRLKKETKIRAEYEARFISPTAAADLGAKLQIDSDKTAAVLERARGNGPALAAFLQKADPRCRAAALDLLTVLAAKDLTDINAHTLHDHLSGSLPYQGRYSAADFRAYVLQPRISLEVLRPYRKFFRSRFTAKQRARFRADPAAIKVWIDKNINSVPQNGQNGWPTPRGVFELRAGDVTARRILFVALARSCGIAARLSAVDGTAQYLLQGIWLDAGFTNASGTGIIALQRAEGLREQKYFQDFSLARLKAGCFHTLRFKGLDEEACSDADFSFELPVRPGRYRLTAGRRLQDGSITGYLTTFCVKQGQTSVVALRPVGQITAAPALGELARGAVLIEVGTGRAVELDKILTEKPLVLVWLDPEREPSRHLLRDLSGQGEQFEKLGAQLLFSLGEDKMGEVFSSRDYSALPAGSVVVLDRSYRVLQSIEGGPGRNIAYALPIVLTVGKDRTVRRISTGYRIGTAAHILAQLKRG